jgi:zinc transporter ZupT
LRIVTNWPLVSRWLAWWMQQKHAGMVFPVVKNMSPELFASLPDSSNAIESMHSVFYQIAQKKNGISFGFQLLVLFAHDLEERGKARLRGESTQYGQAERWKV